ncbi:MAG TPA: cation:dicarboxylase symporter family transporter [Vicinamibacterales bacterium]|jgi:proton glutamate symport protein|nr:cation:dicarboxylase symporter family transporter [Vicinamibacterales bacterium]
MLLLRWLAIAALVVWAARRKSLTIWILISMVVGAEVGHDFPEAAVSLRVLSQIFLRLIRTIVAPLIFATLVVGIAGHSNLRQVGRMGVKALIYFEVVTTLALVIGWVAITVSRAGVGVSLAAPADPALVPPPTTRTWQDLVLEIFPDNFAKAVVDAQMLQVVVFSVIFGIALALIPDEKRKPLLAFADSLAETMFRFTRIVMLFAPFGVGAAIAYTVGRLGIGVLANLFQLVVTFYLAVFAFVALVLVPVALIAKVPIRRFAEAVAEPVSIAFATTSSEAALPRAMQAMERIGVPRQIVAFVMPTGYSFNLDGSTLYLSLASIFVAQAAGIEMTIGQQLVMLLTLMLSSKGVAGVPRSALVILLGTVSQFNLPVEPVLVILGIDAVLDMLRTSLNVLGNCLATVVIARWEGEYRG